MESSFLNHFLGGLGYWGGTICATIAHRREDSFKPEYREIVRNGVRVALAALADLRARYPEDDGEFRTEHKKFCHPEPAQNMALCGKHPQVIAKQSPTRGTGKGLCLIPCKGARGFSVR